MSRITEPVDKRLQAEYVQAEQDLFWLADHGALSGVAELLRERRRQIEAGYTTEHDRQHENGWLMGAATARLTALTLDMLSGLAGYPEVEHGLSEAGAFAAAEIDRLLHLLGDPE